MKRPLLCLLFLLAACAHPAPVSQPHVFGNWEVTKSETGKDKALCYAGAAPAQSTGTAVAKRAVPYLMVTKRMNGKLELSASSGFPYMRSSDVSLVIDGVTHHLFFKGSVAWARGDGEDLAIIGSIKSGSVIELRGVSVDGKTATDTYISHGFWQAIAGIKELCP